MQIVKRPIAQLLRKAIRLPKQQVFCFAFLCGQKRDFANVSLPVPLWLKPDMQYTVAFSSATRPHNGHRATRRCCCKADMTQ